MKKFGSIRKVGLKEVWANEPHDFTPWLAENLDTLSNLLGLELVLKQREAAVGNFSVDILAHDLSRNCNVVIENQFGATDHDHLGKLLTYAAGHNAKVIVWIAGELREEHRQAIDYLNQHTDSETEFYGVVVEVLKIDDSLPAINFRLVSFPNDWGRSTSERRTKEAFSEKEIAYEKYFQTLIDQLREKYQFTNARKGLPQNWYSFSSGTPGISYSASFTTGSRIRSEIYIDFKDYNVNKKFFDRLQENKKTIERAFGEPLDWERLDNKRACRIAVYRECSITDSPERIKATMEWTIKKLIQLRELFNRDISRYLDDELAA
jgi:hypothetical protein